MNLKHSALLVLVLACPAFAQEALPKETKTLTVNRLPTKVDEFLALRKNLAGTPEGGATLFVVAMLVHAKNKDLGLKCFTIALDRSQLRKTKVGYKGYEPGNGLQFHLKAIPGRKYYPQSYVQGTSPAKGYATKAPFKFKFKRNKYSVQKNGDVKVFIYCSGADSPRPLRLRKNSKGLWKAIEFSTMFVGVRPAPKQDDDDI